MKVTNKAGKKALTLKRTTALSANAFRFREVYTQATRGRGGKFSLNRLSIQR